MKISLIIATRNRPDELERMLTSLVSQSYRDFEVIVVDQSIERLAEKNKSMVCLLQDVLPSIRLVSSDKRGLSRARNLGLTYATGDLVGFPDDDCWYCEDVLEKAVKNISQPGVGFISGQYTEPGLRNDDFPDGSIFMTNTFYAGLPSSVTIFVYASILKKIGFEFDEDLGAGTELPIGEETDLVYTLISAGICGYYDSSFVVYHRIDKDNSVDTNVNYAREMARGYLIGKHSSSLYGKLHALGGLFKLLINSRKNRYKIIRARLRGLKKGRSNRLGLRQNMLIK